MGQVKGSGEGAGREKRKRVFFLGSPSPFSFFLPRTYRTGYYFYSPQSSTVIKSKMVATTVLRTLACVAFPSSSRTSGREQKKKELRGRGRRKKEPLPPFFFCFRSNFRAITRLETLATQAIREGVLRISSDIDDRMGAKIKTQKNHWTKIYSPKNPMPNFRAIMKISRKHKMI